jgi:integral membrane sensor domain MASE1
VVTSTLLSSLSTISAARDNSPGIVESSVVAKRILRTVRPALLVAISYYVGTRIGFAWTPIGQPNSTFWPANAILLSALLLTPPRTWWTLLRRCCRLTCLLNYRPECRCGQLSVGS